MKPEDNLRCHSQGPSSLFFWDSVSQWPATWYIIRLNWSSREPRGSCPYLPSLGWAWIFCVHSGDQTQVLVVRRQTLHWLSHLPSSLFYEPLYPGSYQSFVMRRRGERVVRRESLRGCGLKKETELGSSNSECHRSRAWGWGKDITLDHPGACRLGRQQRAAQFLTIPLEYISGPHCHVETQAAWICSPNFCE